MAVWLWRVTLPLKKLNETFVSIRAWGHASVLWQKSSSLAPCVCIYIDVCESVWMCVWACWNGAIVMEEKLVGKGMRCGIRFHQYEKRSNTLRFTFFFTHPCLMLQHITNIWLKSIFFSFCKDKRRCFQVSKKKNKKKINRISRTRKKLRVVLTP